MRAVVVTGPGEVEVAPVDEPGPGGRPLLRVRQAGVCGTDLKIVRGEVPVTYPRVLGHELVCEVVDPGTSDLARGDRVLVDPSTACGRCRQCRHDMAHLCPDGGLMGRDLDGGFSDYVAVDEGRLLPIPDVVGDADSALLQVLGTCVHAQRLVEAFPGQSAVVVGLGVSGLLHLQLLRLRGFRTVIGISRSPRKLELGAQLGAVAVTPEDAPQAVPEALGGRGPDLVIESAGKVATLAQAIELAPLGGRVLVFGTISEQEGALPFYELYRKELVITNARSARYRDYERAVELAAGGGLRLAPLVTGTYPLEQAPAALRDLAEGGGGLKVVLDLSEGR